MARHNLTDIPTVMWNLNITGRHRFVSAPRRPGSGAAPDPLSRARPDGGLDRYT
jgi:hypothetical protein